MTLDRPDLQHTTLLRIAACTTAEQLTATLAKAAQPAVDSAQLVQTAADTIPAPALLALAQAQPASDAAQWTGACVQRALSIDATTGRIDQAISWLEHTQHTCVQTPSRPVLAYARLVQAMGAPAGALGELAGLAPDQAVGWAVGRLHDALSQDGCSASAGPRWSAVGRVVQADELCQAWTAWWAVALGDGDGDGDAWQHAVFRQMLQEDCQAFAAEIRLAAALLLPGVFAEPETLERALQEIDDDDDDDEEGGGGRVDLRRLPGDVLAAAVAGDAGRLVRGARRHLGDVAGGVRALAEAWHALRGLGVSADTSRLLSLLVDPAESRQLLAHVLQTAPASNPTGWWADISRLRELGLFGQVSDDRLQQKLLENGRFGEARAVSEHTLGTAGRRAAREMFGRGDLAGARRVLEACGDARMAGRVEAAQLAQQTFAVGPVDTLGLPAGRALGEVLQGAEGAYRRAGTAHELGRLLGLAKPAVAALLLRSAVQACDYAAAYEVARKAEKLARPPSPVLAAALAELARRWAGAEHPGRRAEVAALALRTCPAEHLQEAVGVWLGSAQKPHANEAPPDVRAEVARRMAGSAAALAREQGSAEQGAADVDVDGACVRVRSMDAAIVGRSVRGLHGDARARVLLAWLDYAAEQDQGRPMDPAASRLRAQVERALVADHCARLLAHLAPQLTRPAEAGHAHMYRLYARAADAAGRPGDAEQARVRARLAVELAPPVARVVGLVLAGRLDELGRLCDGSPEQGGLAAAAAALAGPPGVQRIAAVDGEGLQACAPQHVASALAWRALEGSLADPAESLLRLIAQPEHVRRARALVAFGRPGLPMAARRRLLLLLPPGAPGAGGTPDDRALAYVDALPADAAWTQAFDAEMAGQAEGAGEDVRAACGRALRRLAQGPGGAGVLVEAQAAAARVCGIWAAEPPSLAAVYGGLLAEPSDDAGPTVHAARGALALAAETDDAGLARALRCSVLRAIEDGAHPAATVRLQLVRLCEAHGVGVDEGVHLLVLARALWRWTDVALEQVRGDRFAT
ncbi:hypothetical protein LPJ53_005191, partial [Coemansia erecta]